MASNRTVIRPDATNANKGTERGRYMVETSLRETGAGRSILLDADGRIIAGNKTFEAATDIGLPVRIVETDGTELIAVQRTDLDLSDPTGTARKLAYYDNRASQVGLEWDAEQVLADITAGVDLDAMFSQKEIDELLADLLPKTDADAEPQIDRAAELNEIWQVKTGDVWAIGEHRLVCGDCTDPAVVAKVMQGEKAQVLFTSPPYWVGFEYEQEDKWSEILAFIERFSALYVSCVNDDGRIIINTGTVQAGELTGQRAHLRLLIDVWVRFLESNGWLMRYVRFWVKDGGLLHTSPQVDCIDQHTEFIGYFYNPSAKFRGHERTNEPWAGKGYWDDMPGVARTNGHVAAFPVEMPERNIQLFTRTNEIVLEPFCGSGTTLVACQNLGRRGRGIEVSENYCAVILERMKTAFDLVGVRIDSQVNT